MSTNLQYAYSRDLNFDTRRLLAQFIKPIYRNVFFQSKDALIHGASFVDFSKDSWLGYPLQFCQDYYRQQYLYPIILLVNNIGTMFAFRPENLKDSKIIAPTMRTMMSVLSNAKE